MRLGTFGGSLIVIALLAYGGAAAAQNLHGTVLAVQAMQGTVVLNTTASKDMPAMTMQYRVASPAALKMLHVGATIDANVDRATSPFTLSGVREVGVAPLGPSPIREVKALQIGDTVPSTLLIDQQEHPFTLAAFRGQNLAIDFIYTRCPDPRECPLTTAKFNELQKLLAGTNTHLLLVTLDPQYDTPAVMAHYAKINGADPKKWTLATGNMNDVLNFDAAFGLDPFEQGDGNLIHGETLALVDSSGIIRNLVYTNSWSTQEIVSEINGLNHKATNIFQTVDLWLSSAAVSVCGNNVAGFDGFTDLLVLLAIVALFSWIFWRVFRAIMGSRPAG